MPSKTRFCGRAPILTTGREDAMRLLKSAVIGGIAAAVVGITAASAQQPVKIRGSWVAPVANWASILLEKKDLAQHAGKSCVMEPVRCTGTPPILPAMA